MATSIYLPRAVFGVREAVLVAVSSVVVTVSLLTPVGAVIGPALVITLGLFLLAQRAPHIVICCLLAYLCFEQFILRMASDELILMLKPVPELVLVLVLVARARELMGGTRDLRAGLAIVSLGILVVAISWFVNGNPLDDGLFYGRKILRYTPLVLVMPIVFRTDARLLVLKRFLLILAGLQIGIGMLQLIVGEQAYLFFRPSLEMLSFHEYDVPVRKQLKVIEGTRLIGTLGSYMDYALFLFFVACFALPDLLKRNRNAGWLARGLFFVALCACILLSFSRMTIAAAILGFGVCLTLTRRRAIMLGFFAFCVFLAAMPYVMNLTVAESGERATGVMSRVWGTYDVFYLDPTRYTRAFLSFVVAPAVITAAPLVGIGPGYSNFGVLDLPNWSVPLYMTDNGYVNLLVHHGLMGAGLFVTLVAWLIFCVQRALKRTGEGIRRTHLISLQSYLIGMVMVNFFVDVMSVRYASFAFWMAAGLAVQASAWQSREDEEPAP